MPPIGSAIVDDEGLALIKAWIDGLPEAISGTNSYWYRGPGDPPPTSVEIDDARESFSVHAPIVLFFCWLFAWTLPYVPPVVP